MRRLPSLLLPLALVLLPACPTPEDAGTDEEWPEPTWPELRSELPHDASPSLDAAERETQARDNRLLALDLYHELRQDSATAGANLLLSPYSIRTAFGMLYGGAVGAGRDQMTSVLHYSLAGERQHVAFNWIDDELASRQLPGDEDGGIDPVIVLPANAVWVEKSIQGKIEQPFVDLLSVHYDTGLRLADFIGNKEVERVAINRWVEARTRGLIPELLPPAGLPENLTMILINALYMKSPWASPFDGTTRPAPFITADGGSIDAVLMSHSGVDVDHGVGADYQIVAIPLRNPALEMIALMPTGDFATFEDSLDETKLAAALASLESAYVQLEFPRLHVAGNFELSAALKNLGMTLPYAGGVFEDIGGVDKLFAVYHQVKIIADEDGVEAAAATAIVLDDEAGGGADEVVRIDRAFFLMIRDKPTDTLLFFGRVLDPEG